MKNKKSSNQLKAETLIKYASLVKEVFKDWKPYDYQKTVLKDLFVNDYKYVFCNWSRKSGKTEVATKFLILKALLIPNAQLFYISKTQENAKKVVWGRLKAMVPRKYLLPGSSGIKESDLSIQFSNGSIIYLLGSKDVDAYIGTSPDSVVYDEYRTHSPLFNDVMSPNYFKPHCQILIISTPPDLLDIETGKCSFYYTMKKMCESDPRNSYYDLACWEGNPDLQDFYKEEKKRYEFLGRMSEFEREYEVKYVKGTKRSMFPEFSYEDLVPHRNLMRTIVDDSQYEWAICADTSGWTRWGVLFVCIDKSTLDLKILDCITIVSDGNSFEDRKNAGMSAYALWPKIERKMKELYPGSNHADWSIIWDCQDVPIMDDINRWYGEDITFLPVNKKIMGKTESLSLIRDLKILNKLWISEKAEELIDEFKAMEVNPATERPYKRFDELSDCFRYILHEFCDLYDKDSIRPKQDKKVSSKELFFDLLQRGEEKFDNKEDRLFGSDGLYINGDIWNF